MDTKIMNVLNDVLLSFGDKYYLGKELNKAKVIQDIDSYNEEIIVALLSNELVKKHYTKQIDKYTIIETNRLIETFEMDNYWMDSYTKYSKKIGLTSNGHFLDESTDVVLDFPYKDTVLKGGMSKEDIAKEDLIPNEQFYNEVIAAEEIDMLLDKKILVNAKRYTSEGIKDKIKFSEVDNLVLKGNNLQILSVLKNKFSNTIKSIIIDPPYNTSNDSFQYNDKFNHSSWLIFMKNRLEESKKLLSEEGSISIFIDYNELPYLMILCDEIFGKENFQNLITVKRASASGPKVINPGVVNISDYIVVYSKNKSKWTPNKVFTPKKRDNRYNQYIINKFDHYTKWEFCSLNEAFANHIGIAPGEVRKKLGENYDARLDEFVYRNAENVFRFVYLDNTQISQAARDLKEVSKNKPNTIYYLERPGYKDYYMINGNSMLFASDRLIEVEGEMRFGQAVTDIWTDVLPNDLHNEGGVSFRKGKKPEKLVERLIELTSNENDLILDFFAGSGTTGAVAQKKNRKYILVEQMDYIDNVLIKRMSNTIIGNRTNGISSEVNWQGGGSFVYAELMEKSKGYLDSVLQAENTESLRQIYRLMLDNVDLDFRADLERVQEMLNDAISLDDKKRLLVKVIDKNQLYYNYSEIDDENVRNLISDDDYAFNQSFYKEEDNDG